MAAPPVVLALTIALASAQDGPGGVSRASADGRNGATRAGAAEVLEQRSGGAEAQVAAWLEGYDAAFLSKDLERIAAFYDSDVTIFEGGGVNNGWADYRDHHLGPELKMFEGLEFGHTNRKVTMLGADAAYVTSEYFIKAKMKDRTLDNTGRETLIVLRQADGSWKIRHSHTSGRPRRPAAAADAKASARLVVSGMK